ncbi:ribbon-helix-helix protein, CopG family [Acidobacteria bacterium AB60]|nr:ribbon-helix-helix protein, CopG family [Acidobacteria bacterium AB60]
MEEGKIISITVAADLLAKAEEKAAREQRTVNELIADAVTRYLSADPEWEALLAWGREHGKKSGIRSEEDVERMSDEWRQQKRQAAAS